MENEKVGTALIVTYRDENKLLVEQWAKKAFAVIYVVSFDQDGLPFMGLPGFMAQHLADKVMCAKKVGAHDIILPFASDHKELTPEFFYLAERFLSKAFDYEIRIQCPFLFLNDDQMTTMIQTLGA